MEFIIFIIMIFSKTDADIEISSQTTAIGKRNKNNWMRFIGKSVDIIIMILRDEENYTKESELSG